MGWSDFDNHCFGECDSILANAESLGAEQVWRYGYAAGVRGVYLVCVYMPIFAFRDEVLVGVKRAGRMPALRFSAGGREGPGFGEPGLQLKCHWRKSFICIHIGTRSL